MNIDTANFYIENNQLCRGATKKWDIEALLTANELLYEWGFRWNGGKNGWTMPNSFCNQTEYIKTVIGMLQDIIEKNEQQVKMFWKVVKDFRPSEVDNARH